MPKIAIYLPKEDKKKIERWRHRINFSRVFMRALNAEIDRLARAEEVAEDDLAQAADYYRRQLRGSPADPGAAAHKLGLKQVFGCRLPLETVRALLDLRDRGALAAGDRQLVEEALGEDAGRLDELSAGGGEGKRWPDAVYQGVLDGVADAWKQVCEKM